MFELPDLIPDVDDVLLLEPEELGAKLVFLMRKRTENRGDPFNNGGLLSYANLVSEPFSRHPLGNHRQYSEAARSMFELAFAEAWSWLEAQGLLVQAPGMNGANGFRVLSRRARKFEDERDVAKFASARLLSKDALNPKIATTVWSAFMRGEYDVAVLQAMKAVEVAVRDAAGLPQRDIGTGLMRKAFDPDTGSLTDTEDEKSEREARSALFAGAIGSYKNPQSHRDVKS